MKEDPCDLSTRIASVEALAATMSGIGAAAAGRVSSGVSGSSPIDVAVGSVAAQGAAILERRSTAMSTTTATTANAAFASVRDYAATDGANGRSLGSAGAPGENGTLENHPAVEGTSI